jgi:Golgi SNAP receptor complex protein 2
MDDINALYRKSLQTQSELNTLLDSVVEQKTQLSIATQQRLSALSSDLRSTVGKMRDLLANLPAANRATWDRRVMNLENDASSMQGQVDKQIGHLYRHEREEQNRKALFGERANAKAGPQDDHSAALNERSSLQKSSEMLDDILGQGKGILDSLVSQNNVLKNAKKKLLDVASAIGVSNSLVGVIDRRQTADKWLVYGGMALTLFILFSLWYLLRF